MVTWNIVSKILISQNCREYSYIVALFKVISMFIKAFPFFPVTENSFEIFDLYIRVLSRSGCFCTLRHSKMLVPLLTILFSHLILLIKFLQIPHDFLTDQYFSDVKYFWFSVTMLVSELLYKLQLMLPLSYGNLVPFLTHY